MIYADELETHNLRPTCHVDAGVTLKPGPGYADLACAKCGAEVGRIAVAPRALAPSTTDPKTDPEGWSAETLETFAAGFDVLSKGMRDRVEGLPLWLQTTQNAIMAAHLQRMTEYLVGTWKDVDLSLRLRMLSVKQSFYERISVAPGLAVPQRFEVKKHGPSS